MPTVTAIASRPAERGCPAASAPAAMCCGTCSSRSQCLTAELDGATLQRIDRRLVALRRKVPAGTTLFRSGDRFSSLYAVRSGFVKTLVHAARGREQVTGFRMSGDLVGLDGIGDGRHHVDAVALEDTHVCVIPWGELQELARELAGLQARLHRLMSSELVEVQRAMLQLGSCHAAQRLANFLLELADRLRQRGYSASALVLRMRRVEVGSYLGLELETVSRTLTKLQAAGLMKVAQREVRITDRDGLARVRDGAT